MRPLRCGSRAAVFFNRGSALAESRAQLGPAGTAGLAADAKDLWSKKVHRRVRNAFGGTVAPHGVIMVRVTPLPGRSGLGRRHRKVASRYPAVTEAS